MHCTLLSIASNSLHTLSVICSISFPSTDQKPKKVFDNVCISGNVFVCKSVINVQGSITLT